MSWLQELIDREERMISWMKRTFAQYQRSAGTETFSLSITPEVNARIEKIGRLCGAGSRVDVIRQALAVFDFLQRVTSEGHTATVSRDEDNQARLRFSSGKSPYEWISFDMMEKHDVSWEATDCRTDS